MTIDFQLMPHEGIRTLTPYKPGKAIEELAREQGLTDIIKLASNENALGCSPKALDAIRNLSSHTIATYPSPINHSLMPKLAKKVGINETQLFLSNGSDFIYSLLINCFALHQDKHIMTHDYAFSTYEIQAKSLNVAVIKVPINNNWQVDIDALIKECTMDTALIFIANPNNPTGLLIPQEDIKRLLENIPVSTLLVLDEAYYEYSADLQTASSLDWLKQHPNLVITRTFSKIYGLAGVRLGYAIANPAIISLLQRLQLPFTVNQLALCAAEAAIEDTDFIQQSLLNNVNGMLQIKRGIQALGIKYLPSACNFITFECQEDALSLYQFLLGKGIIVRPLHAYQMDRFIRVSIGTQPQNQRFLNALKTYFKKTDKKDIEDLY